MDRAGLAGRHGEEPAQAWLVALRFQASVTTVGTPGVRRADLVAPPGATHAAESQTTWPLLVTTTCAKGGG